MISFLPVIYGLDSTICAGCGYGIHEEFILKVSIFQSGFYDNIGYERKLQGIELYCWGNSDNRVIKRDKSKGRAVFGRYGSRNREIN